MSLLATTMPSPVGVLTLVAEDGGLRAVLWPAERAGRVPLGPRESDAAHPILRAALAQLAEYFAGGRRSFDVPLVARGTPFQRDVWDALSRIPCGATRSYREIAADIGRPAAVRAVGAAIGRNPLSIIVPCHRVVGTSGVLTGFAGGLDAKRRLLDAEAGQAALAA